MKKMKQTTSVSVTRATGLAGSRVQISMSASRRTPVVTACVTTLLGLIRT